jgi:geranylgeranyl pyrophosphate synthase
MSFTFDEFVQFCYPRIDDLYNHYLNDIPSPELKKAMSHALNNKGKRIRPLLIYGCGYLLDSPWQCLDIPAAAVEMIHTYSLIHDDLPCMDDADLRRGKPTCHKLFGDAIAVLTGDALHTLALEIMANHPAPLSANNRIAMIATLTKACGPYGMAAGQAMDLVLTDKNTDKQDIEVIYQLKTGALLTACTQLGLLTSDINLAAEQKLYLKHYAQCIGLAFQIQDDILDCESQTETLGKSAGIDAKNQKNTYAEVYGLDQSRQKMTKLYDDAIDSLKAFGAKADILIELTHYLLSRNK